MFSMNQLYSISTHEWNTSKSLVNREQKRSQKLSLRMNKFKSVIN